MNTFVPKYFSKLFHSGAFLYGRMKASQEEVRVTVFGRSDGGGAAWDDNSVLVHRGQDLLCSFFLPCVHTIAVSDYCWPCGVRNHIQAHLINPSILFTLAWFYLAIWPKHLLLRILLSYWQVLHAAQTLFYHSMGRWGKLTFPTLPYS